MDRFGQNTTKQLESSPLYKFTLKLKGFVRT